MSGPIQKADVGEHAARAPLPPRMREHGALVPTEFMLKLEHPVDGIRRWTRVFRTPPGAHVIRKGDFHTPSGFKELTPDLVEHLKGLPA